MKTRRASRQATSGFNPRLNTLPLEILDLIALHLDSLDWRGGAHRNVRNLMMVSKAFVRPAQRILYRKPLDDFPLVYKTYNSANTTANRAFVLRETLAKHINLGRGIRSLTYLARAVMLLLDNPVDEYASAAERAVDPWSWQADIVRLAPNASTASLVLRDCDYAQAIGEALQGRRLSDLRLSFPRGFPPHLQQAALRHFASAFGGGSTSRVEELHITASNRCRVKGDDRPEYVVRKLTLDLTNACLATALAFVPKQLAGMEELATTRFTNAPLSAKQLSAPFEGNVLRCVVFNNTDLLKTAPDISKEEYPGVAPGNLLPVALCGLFPHARRLAFQGFRDLDLQKLLTLARSSPLVESLSLYTSYWTIKHEDLATEHPDLSPFEAKLVEILDSMIRLKEIDLGILPYTNGVDCHCGLRRYVERRGVELKVDGCPGWDRELYLGKCNGYGKWMGTRTFQEFSRGPTYYPPEFPDDW